MVLPIALRVVVGPQKTPTQLVNVLGLSVVRVMDNVGRAVAVANGRAGTFLPILIMILIACGGRIFLGTALR